MYRHIERAIDFVINELRFEISRKIDEDEQAEAKRLYEIREDLERLIKKLNY